MRRDFSFNLKKQAVSDLAKGNVPVLINFFHQQHSSISCLTVPTVAISCLFGRNFEETQGWYLDRSLSAVNLSN